MKKKDLEMRLQSIKGFDIADAQLEQYMTPAVIAADVLYRAYFKGDVSNMSVIDLGCGTGMLSIGAWMLGAREVVGFDISNSALKIAKLNACAFGAKVNFVHCDVVNINMEADTVIMNPPFGCHTHNADRVFLNKALDISKCVYSLHMANTLDFIVKYCEQRGKTIVSYKMYDYIIPHIFPFHRETKKTINVVSINIE